VPFGGLDDEQAFSSQCPHCRNYCIDSNQILQSDTDHHHRLSEYAHNKANVVDGHHHEKSKYGHISATHCPIGTKLGTMTHIEPLNLTGG